MAVPNDPFRNPSGLIDRKRTIPVEGEDGAVQIAVPEISKGDSLVSVYLQISSAGSLLVFDATAQFSITTDGFLDQAGGNNAGNILHVTFYDADWGELENAGWMQ